MESLEKATGALNAALRISDDADFMNGLDETARKVIKAGVIQHFEFTYELCWKVIKRWLEENVSPYAGEGAVRRELFRLAAENGLIDDVDQWMQHNKMRNETSHTYNSDVAEAVYAAAHPFALDASRLLATLKAKNG